jgi:hypothetical protein
VSRASILIRLTAILVAGLVPLILTALSVLSSTYGFLMFLVSPALGGFCGALILGRDERVTKIATFLWVALAGTMVYGAGMLIIQLEGMICMILAFPLALPSSLGGAALGKAWLERDVRPVPPGAPLLLLCLGAVDYSMRDSEDILEVSTSVTVSAEPARVWSEVIELGEVRAKDDWVFRTGLAAPVRCELLGTGVGASRICTVTTGDIPEVITRWEPGRILAFNALSTPPPMVEVNPFGPVDAPHLHGFYRVIDGSFEIEPLVNGQTRLTRKTKIGSKIRPFMYWSRICGWGVERGHQVVLSELRRKCELTQMARR